MIVILIKSAQSIFVIIVIKIKVIIIFVIIVIFSITSPSLQLIEGDEKNNFFSISNLLEGKEQIEQMEQKEQIEKLKTNFDKRLSPKNKIKSLSCGECFKKTLTPLWLLLLLILLSLTYYFIMIIVVCCYYRCQLCSSAFCGTCWLKVIKHQ